MRLVIVILVGVGFVAALWPEWFSALAVPDAELTMRRIGTLFLVLAHIWFLGFVLFGDQTVASASTRKRITAVERRLFRQLIGGHHERGADPRLPLRGRAKEPLRDDSSPG